VGKGFPEGEGGLPAASRAEAEAEEPALCSGFADKSSDFNVEDLNETLKVKSETSVAR
jgi:hypothetical protein